MLAISYKKLMLSLQSFFQNTSGVAAIEYAVTAVAVAGVAAAVFGGDGAYQTLLTTFVTTIEGLISGAP